MRPSGVERRPRGAFGQRGVRIDLRTERGTPHEQPERQQSEGPHRNAIIMPSFYRFLMA
jgi:hypothetical protein